MFNKKVRKDIFEKIVFLVVFLAPVYLVRFSVFGIPTNALEILIVLVIALWFLQKNKKDKMKFFLAEKSQEKYFWPVLLIFWDYFFRLFLGKIKERALEL